MAIAESWKSRKGREKRRIAYDTPLDPGQGIIEYICQESERDVKHIEAGASK